MKKYHHCDWDFAWDVPYNFTLQVQPIWNKSSFTSEVCEWVAFYWIYSSVTRKCTRFDTIILTIHHRENVRKPTASVIKRALYTKQLDFRTILNISTGRNSYGDLLQCICMYHWNTLSQLSMSYEIMHEADIDEISQHIWPDIFRLRSCIKSYLTHPTNLDSHTQLILDIHAE